MPSPVRSRAMYRLCMGLGLLLLSAGCANTRPAIIAGPQTAISEPWPFGSLVAHGSRGHRLEIATEAGVFDHATATLIFGGQTWRVTDTDCPQFRAALDAFQTLPSLKPGPGLLRPGARAHPMPPYRPHGETWTIRTELYAPDWSAMAVEMRGGQGPYAFWLSDTVSVIKACGPPTS